MIATLAIAPILQASAQDSMLRTNPNYGSSASVPSTTLVPVPSTVPRPTLQSPPYNQGSLPPITRNVPPQYPPSASLGAPAFDPYSPQTQGNPLSGIFGGGGYNPPAAADPIGYPTTPLPYNNPPPSSLTSPSPLYPQPGYGAPSPYPQPNYGAAPPQTPGGYPSSIYPNTTPPALFPGGINLPQWNLPSLSGGGGAGGFGGQGWNPQSPLLGGGPSFTRLFQGPRLQHGWIYASDHDPASSKLEVHETDASLAFALPYFLGTSQPLYLLPSFGLTLFDGGTSERTFYKAFLEAGWQSDPNYLWGVETGTRVGMYSDFESTSSESFRVQALLQGKMRLTPYTTLKLGAAYIDRVDRDFIPVGGILWQPNPNQRWDLYFPKPKISGYFTTIGTQDVWAYVAGEFGGESWTSSLLGGERFDYRDIRILAGFEWGRNDLISSGRRIGFIEAGYVFNRRIRTKDNIGPFLLPTNELEFDDSFILRAGIGY